MSWLANRRLRREFDRAIVVSILEDEAGIEPSADAGLPHIRIVRNPNDLQWKPWVALGFPGEKPWYGATPQDDYEEGYPGRKTYASTRSGCVRAARARLYAIWLAARENPSEVA